MSNQHPVAFSEEHEEFAAWVRDFASKHSDDYLKYANSDEFPWDLAAELGDAGLLGFGTPEEFGGYGELGGDITTTNLGIIHEELSYANFELAQIAYTCNIQGQLLSRHLKSEDRHEWINGVVTGRHLVAMGVTEPGVGSDMAGLRTRAVKVDGGWEITGEKTTITFAPHAKGVTTLAKTVDPETGKEGFTFFLVGFDNPGVSQQAFSDVAWKPMGRSGIFYDKAFVADEYVLGPVNGGFRAVLTVFDYARVMTALLALGIGRRALDIAVEYAKVRETFGVPISKHQGVAFPLVERATELEAARWLCYRALTLADSGKPYIKEAAMAKYYSVDRAMQTVHDAIVTLGHNGISEEFPLMSMMRDVNALQLGEGAPQIQKLVISRAMFGREFV